MTSDWACGSPRVSRDPALRAARDGRDLDGSCPLRADAPCRARRGAGAGGTRPHPRRRARRDGGPGRGRPRADRRDREDDGSRRHRVRQPGCGDRRARRPVSPLRAHEQRCRRHRPGAPAARRRRAAPARLRPAARGADRPSPGGGETVMMGRTHSVHAEPITFGLKLAGWAFEIDRGRRRLAGAVDEIGTGKISGPVGTYSHLGPDLEAEVLGELGLHADPASTQIVQRDRHAALLGAMAILGGSLERFATEIRNLQHTEIGELQEPFKTGQKGSSAMPHKRNPILSERISGLARLLRSYAGAALENQPLWHERDISHSSAERVILPDATILLDYMLVKSATLIEGLVVRSERMRENIERGLGLHASSRVLVVLVERAGLSREEAYAIVQRAALRAADERRPLRELLALDPTVASHLKVTDLDACFDDAAFLRHVPTVLARLDSLEAEIHVTR